MINFVGTKAIRYTGPDGKKFWEGGGRVVPVINKGDIIIIPELVAYTLTRKNKNFELVSPEECASYQTKPTEVSEDEVTKAK